MLEWRFTAASRFLMAVSLGSQGVLMSYIPHCTVHGSVAACPARGETDRAATTSKREASKIAPSRLDRIGWRRIICSTGVSSLLDAEWFFDSRDRFGLRSQVANDRGQGARQDLDVEPERPPAHIANVEDHHLGSREAVAARDLPQARDPRLHDFALEVPRLVRRPVVGHERSRPHEAHLASEHVEELGQLVEARPPQVLANPGDPRVGLRFVTLARPLLLEPVLRRLEVVRLTAVVIHRPNLPQLEGPAEMTDAPVAVQGGAAAVETDDHHQASDDRGGEYQHDRSEDDVHDSLEPSPPGQPNRPQVDVIQQAFGQRAHAVLLSCTLRSQSISAWRPASSGVVALNPRTCSARVTLQTGRSRSGAA